MAATIHSGSNQVANLASDSGVYTPQDYRQRAKELKRSRGDISCFECRRFVDFHAHGHCGRFTEVL